MTDTADLFEIVFRGDIAPGADLDNVKKRLQVLFKADTGRVDRMFSGRPVVIRSGLNQADVNRYQQAMEKSGALVQVRPVYGAFDTVSDTVSGRSTKDSQPAAVDKLDQNVDVSEAESASSGSHWGLTPVGADVLQDSEKRHHEDLDVDTSSISLAPSGSSVLNEDERTVIEDQDIDTSHLDVDS